MPEDWSKRRDIDLLADGQAAFDFAIALTDLPRVRPQLARPEGQAEGRVDFVRELGWPMANVRVSAQVPLTCQRCLEPMLWDVDAAGQAVMIADAAQADRTPEGLETIFAPESRLSIRDVVEEELMLSLPLVPMHEPGECKVALPDGTTEESAPDADSRQRPFERLGELLKRDK